MIGAVRAPWAGLFFLSILVAACAGTPVNLPDSAVTGLPPAHQLSGLPFHPQVEDQCGPASLATMLGYRGIAVDPETLRGKIYIPAKEGALTTEMVARARRYGLLVYPLRGDLAEVLAEVAAGNPVLVLQNLSFEWLPRWHFSLVTGYRLEQRQLVLRSGDEHALAVDIDLFLRTWQRAERCGVVVMPPEQLPATAEPMRFVAAANDLEQVGQAAAALQAYQAAATRWPTLGSAWFGAGNSAYQLGDYAAASDFFTAYLTLEPDRGAGWNNLAYSLWRRGCRTQALEAVDCALAIEPASAEFADTRAEIAASAPASGACRVPDC